VEIDGQGWVAVKGSVFTTNFRKVAEGKAAFYGNGTYQWDLTDKAGAPVASGLYYLKLELRDDSGSYQRVLKILVLR
jgi:hypothetical protein